MTYQLLTKEQKELGLSYDQLVLKEAPTLASEPKPRHVYVANFIDDEREPRDNEGESEGILQHLAALSKKESNWKESLPNDITQTIKLRSKLVRTILLSLITQTGAYLAHFKNHDSPEYDTVLSNDGAVGGP